MGGEKGGVVNRPVLILGGKTNECRPTKKTKRSKTGKKNTQREKKNGPRRNIVT